ncbi:GP46-like surface antigen, putative [Bodo saltans]|uniref:GP46-like surface antigen, putative n=1 Tax=Bodo saltans TaxID=75058 RepID=A0A0S4J761_BODSA|nr:GP46-like surface antigen, putative [Bodo saltans]|eukprot:CUG86016.1 GP46-like surface antigen, putative [Bodo saltans]
MGKDTLISSRSPVLVLSVKTVIFAVQVALHAVTLVSGAGMCGCEYRYDTLMEFYSATSGPLWAQSDGWGSLDPCSTAWYGVTCDTCATCGTQKDILAITLYSNFLSGTLPESIANLANLQQLDLRMNGDLINSLKGVLPQLWGRLTNLQTLDLSNNGLTGTLPSSWESMSSLQSQDLSSNSLSGTLPASWVNISSLATLSLYSNNLSGTLPDSWGSMPSLQVLYLNSNNLSGTLHESWGRMPNLQVLYLHSNNLSGTLPVSWGSIRFLRELYLHYNSLSGALPASWRSMPNLQVLYLHSNNLSGTLPVSWGSIRFLRELYLYSNSLSGTLPESWRNMSNLRVLYLHSNCLSGTLPGFWGSIQFLASWGNMSNLRDLYLHSNSLTGALPASWEGMSSLQTLDISYNHLSNPLPASLGNISSLVKVNLASNSLTGTLPVSWGSLHNVRYLDLSFNDLSGTIPDEWGRLGDIQPYRAQLNLSFNMLSGIIPVLFAQLNQVCINIYKTSIQSGLRFVNSWTCLIQISYTGSHSSVGSFSNTSRIYQTPSTSVTSSVTFNEVPLVIPKSDVALKAAAQVSSGVGAALAVVAAAPSSGFAVDRLAMLSGFGDCSDAVRMTLQDVMTDSVPSFLDAPLQLSFGDAFGASQRGTVLGNLLVFIIVGIVSLAAVVIHRCGVGWKQKVVSPHYSKTLLSHSAAALRLPGVVIVIVVLLLDSLVASSLILVAYGTSANDISLGVVGLLAVSVLFLAACYILDPRPLSFRAMAVAREQITSDELISTHGLRTRIAAWWDLMMAPSNLWEARNFHSLFVEHFGYLFEGCRGGRHWWILVEATTTIVVSALSSIVPETEAACVTRAWIALALMSVILVACVAAWPMNTRVETGTSIVLLCTQVIVVACAIGGVGIVVDIIGLSVSISSAAVALFPIAWWLVSLVRNCCGLNGGKHPRDFLRSYDFRLRSRSVIPPVSSLSSKTVVLRTNIPSTMSFRGNSELFTTPALRVIIELICESSLSK